MRRSVGFWLFASLVIFASCSTEREMAVDAAATSLPPDASATDAGFDVNYESGSCFINVANYDQLLCSDFRLCRKRPVR